MLLERFCIVLLKWILLENKSNNFFFYQLDIGTVYAQQDHRFVRRWAVLTDPDETLGASGAGVKVNWICY